MLNQEIVWSALPRYIQHSCSAADVNTALGFVVDTKGKNVYLAVFALKDLKKGARPHSSCVNALL